VRARVLEVMADTHFHPNAAARSLATSRSRIIGLVFPRVFTTMFTDPWASVLIKGCIEAAERADLSLVHLLVSTEDDAAVDTFFKRSVMGRHLDGVVLASHLIGDLLVHRLQQSDFPYVLVGRDSENSAHFVDIDNRRAARIATQHLIDHGYRRILHLSGPSDLVTANDRIAGFYDAIADSQINRADVSLVCASFDQLDGYTATCNVLQQPNRPEAIFAGNDAMAIGAIQAAREMGLSVPHDLAVIGFDDIDMNRAFRTELTTVRQPSDVLGRMAVAALVNQINDPSPTPVQQWQAAELIVRGSCGCSFTNRQGFGLSHRKETQPIVS